MERARRSIAPVRNEIARRNESETKTRGSIWPGGRAPHPPGVFFHGTLRGAINVMHLQPDRANSISINWAEIRASTYNARLLQLFLLPWTLCELAAAAAALSRLTFAPTWGASSGLKRARYRGENTHGAFWVPLTVTYCHKRVAGAYDVEKSLSLSAHARTPGAFAQCNITRIRIYPMLVRWSDIYLTLICYVDSSIILRYTFNAVRFDAS